MILLDMMGYKNLEMGRDPMSTRWLQDIIWQNRPRARSRQSVCRSRGGRGWDDHEPFFARAWTRSISFNWDRIRTGIKLMTRSTKCRHKV